MSHRNGEYSTDFLFVTGDLYGILSLMKRASLVFFLGFVIAVTPYLGIPSAWKRIVYLPLGLVLMLVGYQLRRLAYLHSIEDRTTGERKTDVYVEQVAVSAEPSAEPDTSTTEPKESPEIQTTKTRRDRKKGV